jgi:predicted nucleotidyltransferase
MRALIAEAEADPDVVGVVLTGSRALGLATAESDYDVVFVVTDEAAVRYEQSGAPVRGLTAGLAPDEIKDIWNQPVGELQIDKVIWWMLPAFAESAVVYDRSGETARLVDALRMMPAERASVAAGESYDGYLNALYRSLKCWRRGNLLGGRLEAAASVWPLLQTLYALERRWQPYGSRLRHHLHELEGQGWQPGELQAALLDLVTTGDPARQQRLARRVTALLRERGYQHVYESWDGQIDRALAWQFDETP